MSIQIGSANIECPECHEVIEVPVSGCLNDDGERQYLDLQPEMADLWAHAWIHGAQGDAPS